MSRTRPPLDLPTGTYVADLPGGRWWWSAGTSAVHGGERRWTALSADRVRDLYGPAGWQHLLAAVRSCALHGEPFAVQVPVLTDPGPAAHPAAPEAAAAAPRAVVVTGAADPERPGTPLRRVRGHVVDVSAATDGWIGQRVQEQLEVALASRTLIDQAKGALMLAYGVDAEEAFGLLKWYSMHSQVKLAVLAQRLVDLVSRTSVLPAGAHGRVDDLLDRALAAGEGGRDGGAAGGPGEDLVVEGPRACDAGRLLTVRGEVDLLTARRFAAAVGTAEAQAAPPERVVVDLTGVDYLGSAAVSVLTAADRRCRRAGTPLTVVLDRDCDVRDATGLGALDVRAGVPG
ncbi:ANTAR domain-containing protein [Kineococcus terrestris]|uniref:ANTAR domain-containing protein n=1 Tax=Kineococcus terrestris TaxID=2044856 RepID=UPI0034DB3075